MPGRDRVAVRAPGRVNLIGEHTDYNHGLALPFAVAPGITVLAEAIDEDRIEAHAADLGETDAFGLDAIEPAPGWRAFVRGIAAELGAAGHALRGTRLVMAGDLPLGAGLSSSAALEAGLALAMLAVAGEEQGVDRVALAHICSRVERDWVGAQTGLLDQLAVLLGADGQALRLDLRDLEVRRVPLELAGWRLVIVGSGTQHAHAHGGYNTRREECRRACELLGIEALRDATLDDADELPDPLSRRVRHVVTEDERVDLTVAALEDRDLAVVGRLLDASHASLRDDYDVSVAEVEATVRALKDAGAAGARMVGGGFGGSVLALFAPGQAPPERALEVRPGPGARLL
jgi:galactokinase